MNLRSRVTKLEMQSSGGSIPVWCNDAADVPATIDAMIADGEIREVDRGRCVYWPDFRGAGRHEPALAMLQ